MTIRQAYRKMQMDDQRKKLLIVGNGTIITMTENGIVKDGAVVLDPDRDIIADIGETKSVLRKYDGINYDYLDAEGCLVFPGFINAHEHSYASFVRGLCIKDPQPTDFMENLRRKWWVLDESLDEKQVEIETLVSYLDAVHHGVTTQFEHHVSFGFIDGSLSVIGKAADQIGIRTCSCFEVSDRNGMEKADAAIRENVRWMKEAEEKKDGLNTGVMGLHASFTLSDRTLTRVREALPEGGGCHIHVAESKEDVEDCISRYGVRIPERLERYDLLNDKTIIAHGVFLNRDDMERISRKNAAVVNNFESNMNNAVGCPPTRELVYEGILTCLGMDGYTHSVPDSLRNGSALLKLSSHDINAGWGELWKMVTEGNPILAGRFFDKKFGQIAEGFVPDLVLSRYDPPTPLNRDTLEAHLIFGLDSRSISTVICHGRIVMRDGVVLGVDEEKVLAESRVQARRLWEKM